MSLINCMRNSRLKALSLAGNKVRKAHGGREEEYSSNSLCSSLTRSSQLGDLFAESFEEIYLNNKEFGDQPQPPSGARSSSARSMHQGGARSRRVRSSNLSSFYRR